MPGGTTSNRFYFTYVLHSRTDGKRYVGFTNDLKKRLTEHMEGLVPSTAYRRPLEAIYFEACLSESDARRREGYLKTTDGRRFLAKRLKHYLTE